MNLTGKLCLVTGANGDLGFALSQALLKAKAKLVISCRLQDSAEATKNRLLKLFPKAEIIALELPLHDLPACKQQLTEFLSLGNKLDVLINNAGIHIGKYDKRIQDGKLLTGQGFEINFQVNYLAPVLITEICKPSFAENARIIHVFSKDYESLAKFDFSDVQQARLSASGHVEYARSKLALALYQQWCLHNTPKLQSFIATPGVTKTKLWDNVPKLVLWFMRKKFHSVEAGIVPIIQCLEIQNSEVGCYIGYSDQSPGWQAGALNHLATDFGLQEKLWLQTQEWFKELNL